MRDDDDDDDDVYISNVSEKSYTLQYRADTTHTFCFFQLDMRI